MNWKKIELFEKFEQFKRKGIGTFQKNQIFYSLDAIIAGGYRVNSKEATDFRI